MPIKYGSSTTITLYIAKEFLLTFIVAFLVFFAIFFINQILVLAADVLQKNAPIQDVLRLMVYAMPSFVALSIPFATLVGALLAMGKFSAENEIIAFQASGVPLSTLFTPMIFLGLIFSLGSFVVNDILLPVGTLNYGRLYTSLIFSNPELELESYSVITHQDRILITGAVEGNTIDTLMIIDDDSEGNRRIITGTNAEMLVSGENTSDFSMEIENVFTHSFSPHSSDSWDYAQGQRMKYTVPLKDITDVVTRPGPHQMSSIDVYRDIQAKLFNLEQKQILQNEKVDMLRSDAYNSYWFAAERNVLLGRQPNTRSITKAFDFFTVEDTRVLTDSTLKIYEIEFHKKFAIPFASIAFIVFAFPIGLFSPRSGRTVNLGIGLFICVIYWFMLLGGQTLGTQHQSIPAFWTMWFPNVLLIGTGIIAFAIRNRK